MRKLVTRRERALAEEVEVLRQVLAELTKVTWGRSAAEVTAAVEAGVRRRRRESLHCKIAKN